MEEDGDSLKFTLTFDDWRDEWHCSTTAYIEHFQLPFVAYVFNHFGGWSELLLAQQFPRSPKMIPHHLLTSLIDRADASQPLTVIDCEQGVDGNVWVIQEVGAMAGDNYLAMLGAFTKCRKQYPGRSRMKCDFRFLKPDQKWGSAALPS